MKNLNYQTKTRQQIASEYGITSRTLRRWLKKNKVDLPKRLLCPKEQKTIYSIFGYPTPVNEKQYDSI